ncbi:hypothetical protein [Streptomyces sp. CBMA123]|uniref:hypothetical protein n=1 Tax=Streptomyces sp. CBMA123 TaxID=1896313 RepID=UPI001661C788|nr:hypothetical protein [Streptomyces sp. CBMA123]MBD0695330.1 hypothetical protein [Streptomyces sp. CBMA123]
MNDRYAIVPADAPRGTYYQAWVVRDRATDQLVRALPPADEPLRFYSYVRAQAWVRTNTPAPFEVRLIDSGSPHFVQLDSWGLWNPERHEYLRAPGSSSRIRRFYSRTDAEAFRRSISHPTV